VALAIFLVMCASDAIDGYMARVRKQTTLLGSFLDPLADKLLITCACVLLASPGTAVVNFELPDVVVVLIIGKDVLLMLGFVVLHLTTGQKRVDPLPTGKLATVLQLAMVASILAAPELAALTSGWSHVVRLLYWAAAVVAVLTILVYIRRGLRYIEHFTDNGKGPARAVRLNLNTGEDDTIQRNTGGPGGSQERQDDSPRR